MQVHFNSIEQIESRKIKLIKNDSYKFEYKRNLSDKIFQNI